MRRIPIKAMSILVACSITLPFAACKKSDHGSVTGRHRSGNKIYENSPWFDVCEIEVDNGSDTIKDGTYRNRLIAGADENCIVALSTGRYNKANSDGRDVFGIIEIIDRASNDSIRTIDIYNDIPVGSKISTAEYHNGVVTVHGSLQDSNQTTGKKYKINYDPQSGKKLGLYEMGEYDETDLLDHVYLINGYEIKTSENYGGKKASVNISISSEDGDCSHIELKNPAMEYYFIPTLLQLNENTVIAPIETDGEERFYKLDLNNFDVHPLEPEEYKWLDIEGISASYYGSDGYAYYVTNSGIRRIDSVNEEVKVVFDFNNCALSRTKLTNAKLIYCDEDSFILASALDTDNSINESTFLDYKIYEFTRAEKNPNAGKTVLELYVNNDYVDKNTGEAIVRFNESNSEYYIEISDLYSSGKGLLDRTGNNEPKAVKERNRVSCQLAEDIVNGTGPDILINTSGMEQICNSEYLLNLSMYFDGLDSKKYFTNIFEAAKTNGKLYQVPIAYLMSGIQTDAKNAGKSGEGFTFDEYEKFLKDSLSGKDIIGSDQAEYFARLFGNMRDRFITGNRVDFSTPEFEEMVRFVENASPDDRDSILEKRSAMFAPYCGILSYLCNDQELGGSSVILGLPSSDGRGAMAKPCLTVAISLRAADVDACMEFVRFLMSDEMQRNYAFSDYYVVNREALREVGKLTYEYMTTGCPNKSDGTAVPESCEAQLEQSINGMEETILRCTLMSSDDTSVEMILAEEMAHYFAGEKDLDEVKEEAKNKINCWGA